jgi:arylsulfatase A-like enzyme
MIWGDRDDMLPTNHGFDEFFGNLYHLNAEEEPENSDYPTDPYERAQITSNTYYDWLIDRAYLLVPAQDYVGQFLSTFKKFPPRQKAASFSLDQVMDKLSAPAGAQ